ncbi:MAG: L-2-amino-thiazoline-4-carboxylic acid hydrolase, partial [Candidatus Bathyarchaeia archaeon]
MDKKTTRKFQEKMELTYERYFHARYDGMVQLVREFERVLGREKAFEIVGKNREKVGIDHIRKQMAERGPIKNFEDFKAFVKEEQRSPFWSHAVTVTYPEETPKKFVIRITECLIAKTFKE